MSAKLLVILLILALAAGSLGTGLAGATAAAQGDVAQPSAPDTPALHTNPFDFQSNRSAGDGEANSTTRGWRRSDQPRDKRCWV